MNHRKIGAVLFLFFAAIGPSYAQQQRYRIVRGVADIHSNISDGRYPLEKICALAKDRGITVLIFGDSALRKWEYGLWPLRNFIKMALQENSVLRLGSEKYMKKLEELKKEYPALLIIPALEANPFYYWQGNPLSRNFSLNDSYKQFLIIGLAGKDFQALPLVGWHSKFNQYQGAKGIKPYQALIDYVNQKGGLIFWAHPQMASLQRYRGIEVYTPEHPEDLILSKDYTGFGLTFTDRLEATEIGGIWDELLLEYAQGRRKKPAWIIGNLHYDGFARKIDAVETLFFLKEPKPQEEEVIAALRQGRMYVRFNLGPHPLVLKEFSVKNVGSGLLEITICGQQLTSSEPIKIELIRNGKLFKSIEENQGEWKVIVEDNFLAQDAPPYYRIKIIAKDTLILSNPLFVKY